jgi:hypothetical protein
MRSDDNSPLRRLRAPKRTKGVIAVPVAAPPEPIFICENCRREHPISERSRVARGRCRACV